MKRFFLLQIMFLLLLGNAYTQEKISLTLSDKKPSDTQNQIPIDASIQESTITLLFKENVIYQVIVKGEEGIVYQKLLTATTAKEI